MNSLTFVFLFVFTVGSLAAKIPNDVDKNETPVVNTESLGKRISSDRSIAQDDASLIPKGDVGRHKRGSWVHLNRQRRVCFGARGDQYGSFTVPKSGYIEGIKLVHRSGSVTCCRYGRSHYSNWGCGSHSTVRNYVDVVITTSRDDVILPLSQYFSYGNYWSQIPGYDSYSQEIILWFSPYYYWMTPRQHFRLWYGEDLVDRSEGDNNGRVCADAYARYV